MPCCCCLEHCGRKVITSHYLSTYLLGDLSFGNGFGMRCMGLFCEAASLDESCDSQL